jgi:ACS family sodium-dependent inorganic phosphate cotransporter-like MFS transporter 5
MLTFKRLHLFVALINPIYQPNANAVFNWDAEQQGIILGAFYYGFFVTQIPGGALAEKFGGKWVYGMGVLVPAILNLLTPSAAYAGTIPFIILKVVQGLGEVCAM